ncbi:MAG: hypothetical protein AB7N76_02375 [Planctomycetota bacterium]
MADGRMADWRGGLLLALLSLFLTAALQVYVGKERPELYSNERWPQAEALHRAILEDHPPNGADGDWEAAGAGGTNHRVLVPFLAHALARLTGAPVRRVYYAIDCAALWVAFPLLFLYLRRWLPVSWSLVGVLYLAAVLPTTYHYFYFHPWDRVSLLCWLAALALLRDRRPLALGLALAIGTLVKFDLLFLPLLYLATWWPPRPGEAGPDDAGPDDAGSDEAARAARRRALLETGGLLLATWGVFLLVSALRPTSGTRYQAALFAKLAANLRHLLHYHLRHPALVLLLLPALLAASFRPAPAQRDARLLRWLAPFAALHLPIYLGLTYFREARALVPFALLLLPPALLALQAWTEPPAAPTAPAAPPAATPAPDP